jgi:MYXO-CTERM domain-containing protein
MDQGQAFAGLEGVVMQFKRVFTGVAAATALFSAVMAAPAQATMLVDPTLLASGTFDAPSGFVTFAVSKTSFTTLGLYAWDPVITSAGLTDLTTGLAVAFDQSSFSNTANPNSTDALYDTVVLGYNSLLGGHTYKLAWTVDSASPYELHATFSTAVTSVPEPEVYSLAFAGLAVAALAARRRQRAAA